MVNIQVVKVHWALSSKEDVRINKIFGQVQTLQIYSRRITVEDGESWGRAVEMILTLYR